MSADEQLRWEAENAPRYAAAAFLAAFLTVVSYVVQAVTFRGVSGDAEVLRQIDGHTAGVLAGRLTQALAVVALVVALYYLYKATVARRPEGGLSAFWPVGILAAVLLTVAAVSGYFDAVSAADDFVSGSGTKAEAKKFADELTGTLTGAVGQGGGLCLGLTYVLISLNAMRSGLLSRFMGILGMFAGVLVVIPILPGAVIQLFWTVALGLLFLGRWPNGRGPAWDVVEPVPWPTAADIQAARQAAAEADEPAGDLPEPEPQQESHAPERRRTSAKKRKRRR